LQRIVGTRAFLPRVCPSFSAGAFLHCPTDPISSVDFVDATYYGRAGQK